MAVQVIVLAEQSPEIVGECLILPGSQATSPLWREVNLELVRRARRGGAGGAEVFLCLLSEQLEDYDSTLFLRLVKSAREHTWGARIHAVVDQREQLPDEETLIMAREWVDLTSRNRVAHLLQAAIRGREKDLSRMVRSLRAAHGYAQERSRALRGLPPAQGWKVAVPQILSEARPTASFLAPFVLEESPLGEESNLLVVVKESQERVQRAALGDTLLFAPKERIVVATLGVEAKDPLRRYCLEQGIPLIHFSGPLELRFFVQRINQEAVHGTRLPAPSRTGPGVLEAYRRALEAWLQRIGPESPRRAEAEVLEIRLRENLEKEETYGETPDTRADRAQIVAGLNRVASEIGIAPFTARVGSEWEGPAPTEAAPTPTLLLTHAFDPESEPESCLLAARYVASILEDVPRLAETRVHLAIAHSTLHGMMDGMTGLTAWIFLGPARGPEGLWDVASGCCVAPEGWAACFRSMKPGPSLAILIAGGSEETARHLAASGVACAVGLDGGALSDSLVTPLKELFRQMWSAGVDCRWIEAHFSQASDYLRATGANHSMPKVFCAGHP